MTLIEQAMFREIKPWELIGLAWAKDKSRAPNITAMIQHFNKALIFRNYSNQI